MKKIGILLPFLLFLAVLAVGCDNSLHLEYSSGDGGFVIGNPSQELSRGEDGTKVEAIPAEGYQFYVWSDGVTTAQRQDLAVTENKSVVAIFHKIEKYTLRYTAGEGGYLVGDGEQIVLAGESGTKVLAIPQTGYEFLGWDDEVESSERVDENVRENKTISAIFQKIQTYTLEYTAEEGGYIIGDSTQTVVEGENGTKVLAIPGRGYEFLGWDDEVETQERTEENVRADGAFLARFSKIFTIQLFSSDSRMGVVSSEGSHTLLEGETFEFEAEPMVGYRFSAWSDGVTEPQRSLVVEKDLTLVAYFEMEALSLPILQINTQNGAFVVEKDTYLSCTVSVSNCEYQYEFNSEPGKIKGRGNSTWDMFPKKPYKLKFTSKTDLFGFGAAKTWVLLADHGDKSLLRNRLAFAVGSALELEYNNCSQPVELYFNGEYEGEYLLCKQTETGSNRVDIDDQVNPEDQGFLIELDGRASSEGKVDVDWFTYNNIPYSIKGPETDEEGYDPKATKAIKKFITECWTTLTTETDYQKIEEKFETTSFAKTYVVCELFKQNDVNQGSWYLYREPGGKLTSGPLWDFDISTGNVNYNEASRYPNSLYAVKNVWYAELLKHNEFKQEVAKILKEQENTIKAKVKEIVDLANQNKDSYLRNFERWDILGKPLWPNPGDVAALKTWEEQVNFVVKFLDDSYAFLLKTYPVSA